jgi:hypothetical protein
MSGFTELKKVPELSFFLFLREMKRKVKRTKQNPLHHFLVRNDMHTGKTMKMAHRRALKTI